MNNSFFEVWKLQNPERTLYEVKVNIKNKDMIEILKENHRTAVLFNWDGGCVIGFQKKEDSLWFEMTYGDKVNKM